MKNLKFIIASVLLAIGISNFIYWFKITRQNISFEAMKNEYESTFPSFLQNSFLITLILMVILSIAGVLFLKSRDQNSFKAFSICGMILSFLLAFWLLFTLM